MDISTEKAADLFYRRSGIKIFSHKQKKYITVSTFLYTYTASQLFSARRPIRYLQVTHGKHMTTFCSVSDTTSVFTATICAYRVLQFSFAYKQFINSCVVATNAASCWYSTFSWRVQSHAKSLNLGAQIQFNTIKIFCGYILDHKNKKN